MSIQKILGLVVVLALAAGTYYYFTNQNTETKQQSDLLTKVRKGEFVIKVTATGELQAKRSEKFRVPRECVQPEFMKQPFPI